MIDEGTVYLIHLDSPIAHSQHYIGWANNTEARLHYHKTGKGARFLAVANQLGIDYRIVRTWPGSKELERELKNYKRNKLLCPVCNKDHSKYKPLPNGNDNDH